MNRNTMIALYYSFIYPYFTYCNQIWGSASASSINRLFILQKKAVRIICLANPRTHISPLFKELRFLNIWQVNKYLIGQFMYKHFRNCMLPSIFDKHLTKIKHIHSHETKQASRHYYVPNYRTDYRRTSYSFRGPLIWNSIMLLEICPSVKLNTFQIHLKNSSLDGALQ